MLGLIGRIHQILHKHADRHEGGGADPIKRYAAYAYLNNAQNIPTGTWTKVNLDAEVFDEGNAFDTTNKKYVVPVAGKYQINATLRFGTNSVDQTVVEAALYINSFQAQRGGAYHLRATNQSSFAGVNCCIILSANDNIELYVYQGMGADKALVTGQYNTFLSIFKI